MSRISTKTLINKEIQLYFDKTLYLGRIAPIPNSGRLGFLFECKVPLEPMVLREIATIVTITTTSMLCAKE